MESNTESPLADTDVVFELPVKQSQAFVGRWTKLVSKTNWEKGKIIVAWREKIAESGASQNQYSDEVWSQLVPDVTPQHVGRLRRTHLRFGKTQEEFSGLFWSHFYAALDWNDAEMWLEGAIQSKWSVSEMRRQRWKATGGDPGEKPSERDVVTGEIDEGFGRLNLDGDVRPNSRDQVEGPIYEDPDFGDSKVEASGDLSASNEMTQPAGNLERPFEAIQDLPVDVAEIVESFKLVILRHKMADWQEMDQSSMIAALDALKRLVKSRPE